MTEHWLSIAAGVFLVGTMLYGHYRGLLRQCVSLGALILTIITVKIATPYVADFIKANPAVRENAADFIIEVSGWEPPAEDAGVLPAAQRMAIEKMKLPQSVKNVLLENNNSEFYKLLGVNRFEDTVGSVLVFAVSYVAIHLVIRWLDLLSRLPILCGLNQMAGGVVGLAEGFLILWIAGFVLSFFTETPVGQMLEEQINKSIWLSLIYRYNLMNLLLGGLIKGIL